MDIVVTSIPPGDVKPVTGEALAPGTLLIPLDLVNSWQDNVLLVGGPGGCRQPGAFLPLKSKPGGATAFPCSRQPSGFRIWSRENRRALLRRIEA